MTSVPLLDVKDLTVQFATRRGTVTAVRSVSIQVGKGETVGIVGESGSGKSVTSYAVMRILDRAGKIAEGAITFSGIDVGHATDAAMADLRGREISMIFQNPRMALNPPRMMGWMHASVPPAIITSASPRLMSSAASPIACEPVAQADTTA